MILVEKEVEWTGLKFSPDGKTILISTNGSMIRLIDAFSGSNLQTFTGHLNSKGIPLEASFSPDSQFVISGSTDGRIHIWNAENGTKVCVLNGDHTGPVQCVQFNPKYMMMSSSCKNMSFWLPSVDEDAWSSSWLCPAPQSYFVHIPKYYSFTLPNKKPRSAQHQYLYKIKTRSTIVVASTLEADDDNSDDADVLLSVVRAVLTTIIHQQQQQVFVQNFETHCLADNFFRFRRNFYTGVCDFSWP